MEFWYIVSSTTNELYSSIISSQLFGKKTNKVCILKMYHRVAFYLDIIQDHRDLDADNGGDQGNEYYREYYCIDRIKKALLCSGISSNLIHKMFDVYDLNTDLEGEGVGYDHVENTSPIITVN